MMLGTVETACQVNDEYSDAVVSSDYDNAVGSNVYTGKQFHFKFQVRRPTFFALHSENKGYNNTLYT